MLSVTSARTIERRHTQAQHFSIRTRWWILTTRWADVSWRHRLVDLVYLLHG